jgi:hypothetical protein
MTADGWDGHGLPPVARARIARAARGHTTEFFAIGTAIRPLRAHHVIAEPKLVLPLGDGV